MGLFMSVGRNFGDKAWFGSIDGGDTGRTSSRASSGLFVVRVSSSRDLRRASSRNFMQFGEREGCGEFGRRESRPLRHDGDSNSDLPRSLQPNGFHLLTPRSCPTAANGEDNKDLPSLNNMSLFTAKSLLRCSRFDLWTRFDEQKCLSVARQASYCVQVGEYWYLSQINTALIR
jgi:hypothetical protein